MTRREQPLVLALALAMLSCCILGANCDLGSLSQRLASTGIGAQTSDLTQEQYDSIKRLDAIWARDDLQRDLEREILDNFDPDWPTDKLELKRLANQRLANLLLAERETARLSALTRAQLARERAAAEGHQSSGSPPSESGPGS